jgi:two-component system, chemotaxis family, sensor kinase CheA
VRIGALTPAELQRLLDQQAAAETPTRLGDMAVAQGAAPPQVVQAAVARQETLRQKGGDESRHVRVPADKLDRLITLIGELAIAGSSAQVMAQRLADAPLLEVTERMAQLVESARDDALRLRMVPIGETFARFRRVVRDVSGQLGKEVSLRITGGDAELDKAMVELIADPLMHLVRNALDHGLETPAQRVAAGKPAAGELHLHAAQEAGAIVIEVSDDGRGLDTARILAKAVAQGLVPSGAVAWAWTWCAATSRRCAARSPSATARARARRCRSACR